MFNKIVSCGKNVFNPWNKQGKSGGALGGEPNYLFVSLQSTRKTTVSPRRTALVVHHITHMQFERITDHAGSFSTIYTGPINTNVRI